MIKLNKLLFAITLLGFANSNLWSMKYMPLGQATFNLNKQIKAADTDQKKLDLMNTDEFKTLVLRADRITSADKNALPVIKFLKEIYPETKGVDRINLDALFKKLRKNKLFPALADLAKDVKGYERVGEEEAQINKTLNEHKKELEGKKQQPAQAPVPPTRKSSLQQPEQKTADKIELKDIGDLLDLSDQAVKFLAEKADLATLRYVLDFINKNLDDIKKSAKTNDKIITKVNAILIEMLKNSKTTIEEKTLIKNTQEVIQPYLLF